MGRCEGEGSGEVHGGGSGHGVHDAGGEGVRSRRRIQGRRADAGGERGGGEDWAFHQPGETGGGQRLPPRLLLQVFTLDT